MNAADAHHTIAVRALVARLWPDWKPTLEERRLFWAKLGRLRQGTLEDAVQRAYEERYTAKPSLGHIMRHYRTLVPDVARVVTIDRSAIADSTCQMRAALADLGSESLSAAIDHCKAQCGGSSDMNSVSLGEWTAGQVGTVWAAAEHMELVR